MEIINYEKNDIDVFLSQAELLFNNYLNSVRERSQLSTQESEMMQSYYKNMLNQMKNLLETLKAATISLQQIEYSSSQEKIILNNLYNGIAANNENNPMLEIICNLHNELNALSNLPTTTINEIQRKYFLMNNHFMKTNYFTNTQNIAQTQDPKYKKREKNT